MPPLSKAESCAFIIFCLVALTFLIGTLWAIQSISENCWSKYNSETQAIEMCEKP